MAAVELVMPKMGESIMEATILNWSKQVGDIVEADETILEIATDKVDSEVPSPTDGVIVEILFDEGEVVAIGEVIAIIDTDADGGSDVNEAATTQTHDAPIQTKADNTQEAIQEATKEEGQDVEASRFYSPLVKSIAKQENISMAELEAIKGTGLNDRVTKKDILSYLENRSAAPASTPSPAVQAPKAPKAPKSVKSAPATTKTITAPPVSREGNVEIIEMDRMRRLIADHMVMSKHVSPHVTSFVEADVTNLFNWRKKNKKAFQDRYGEKITFTPIFVEAVIKAIKDFPGVNASVDGHQIILRKDINIGIAAALPSGNLIVPVIKNADYLNLAGLTRSVNDLAGRARQNKLKPDEVQGGTFTISNVGTFGNVMGTPIINQPQVAILAVGAIRKKPAVIETEFGDLIAVRQMMFLSLSYDHRVVDGMLGGSFLKRIADNLEAWDVNREI